MVSAGGGRSRTSLGIFEGIHAAEFAVVLAMVLASRLAFWVVGYVGARFWSHRTVEAFYLCRHDCAWYIDIALHGYARIPSGQPPGASNWAFFPLYPLAMRAASGVTGLNPSAAGALVSNLSFTVAACLLYAYWRHTEERDGVPGARYAVALLCCSPGTTWFMAPYTESLFLALSLGCLYCAARGNWLGAGLCAAALSATRLIGIVFVPVLILYALQRARFTALLSAERRTPSFLLAIAMAPAGLTAFMAYLWYAVGDSLAFAHVQAAWGRAPGNPLRVLLGGLTQPGSTEFGFALLALAALLLGLWGLRRGRLAEAFLLIAGVCIPLATSLVSLPRYTLALAPCYTLGALWCRGRRRTRWLLLAASTAGAAYLMTAWALAEGFVM